jgi:hypothetical protein
MVMLRTVLYEILGALEFAGFLAALGAACVWISRMPWYSRLNVKLFPEVSDD